jgi:hypothetical protein
VGQGNGIALVEDWGGDRLMDRWGFVGSLVLGTNAATHAGAA